MISNDFNNFKFFFVTVVFCVCEVVCVAWTDELDRVIIVSFMKLAIN